MARWLNPRKLYPHVTPILSPGQEAQLPEKQLETESKYKRLSWVLRRGPVGGGGARGRWVL